MKYKIVFVVVFLVAFLIGYLGVNSIFGKPKEKVFESHGMKITLTDEFQEGDMSDVTVYLESDDVGVAAYQESFDVLAAIGINEESTLNEYLQLVIQNSGSDKEIKHEDGLTFIEYEEEIDGNVYYYFAPVFKGDDSFWVVNFFSFASSKDEYRDAFIKWAKTIEV